MTRSTHVDNVPKASAEELFSTAYATWTQWDERARRRMTNILYMHCRAPAYEWDWESFTFEYTVTDALYKRATEVYRLSSATHAERTNKMCQRFKLYEDDATVKEIVSLRNELQHEALWRGGRPGSVLDADAHYLTKKLRCLNQRLIPALLGFEGRYTRSPWTAWKGHHQFR